MITASFFCQDLPNNLPSTETTVNPSCPTCLAHITKFYCDTQVWPSMYLCKYGLTLYSIASSCNTLYNPGCRQDHGITPASNRCEMTVWLRQQCVGRQPQRHPDQEQQLPTAEWTIIPPERTNLQTGNGLSVPRCPCRDAPAGWPGLHAHRKVLPPPPRYCRCSASSSSSPLPSAGGTSALSTLKTLLTRALQAHTVQLLKIKLKIVCPYI